MVSVAANKASRMDQYKNPSLLTLATYFALATALLFFGLVILRLAYLDPSKGALYSLVPSLLLFIAPALIFAIRIAWLLRRPRSDYSKGRPLWLTLPLSLTVVFLLAVFVFAVIFLIHG